MKIRHFFTLLWLSVSALFWVIPANAQSPFGQTIQINTRLRSIIGKPIWLLILRDIDTGVVLPYLFDIKNNQDFWVAFSFSRNYRVTASTLKFGPYAVIHNFCLLEDRDFNGKSLIVSLSGDLTPSPDTANCHILQYNDSAFSIASIP